MNTPDGHLQEFFARVPLWITGHISTEDGNLLERVIGGGLTGPVIEIGVASGWSSAVLLHLMRRIPPRVRDDVWLHSFDIAERCYFDPSRRVGSAVAEVVPELQPHWRLRTGISVDAGLALRGIDAALAFIDGDHLHPWPTIDLLALLPALAPEACVILHDTNLSMGSESEGWRISGAKRLFERWPWAKESCGGHDPNSGVIQLPGDHVQVRALCREVLRERWDVPMRDAVLRAVGLTDVDGYWVEPTRERLMACVDAAIASGRPLMFWGAGSAGKRVLESARELSGKVTAFVDTSPQKWPTFVDGLRVLSPEDLVCVRPRPYVLITSQFAADIARQLAAIGFQRETDYMVAPLSWPASQTGDVR